MKLQSEITDIPVREMKDGEIGIITQWVELIQHIGNIVQRHGDKLIRLQKGTLDSWDAISTKDECRVRILQKGETLIIE